ncbi:MAG: outer membrane beta-barrel protein, partial [Burkholderiales bacterium]|nr:outer membrane beta-barrel protein [Burkholderiales bacterium]
MLAASAVHAQATETTTAVPASDSLTGPTFNTPTGKPALNTAPVAPGAYDLAGIGRRDAAQETILTEPVSGVPVRFENGVFVFPSALVGLGHNDNVIGTAAGKISSIITSIQPRVVAEVKKSGDRYTLTYNGNLTQYAGSSADNFNSHEFTLAGDNYFSARSRLGWSAAYISSADPRGSTDRVQSAEPDRWHAPVLQGKYIYGAKGAQGRFEVDGGLQAKRYDNNRLFTVASDV